MVILITSPHFLHEQPIPTRFASEGDNVAPMLRFAGVPKNAKSLALIVDDPDVDDDDPRVHWTLYNLPPDSKGIVEGALELPQGTHTIPNDFGEVSWRGPCPSDHVHRYHFRLYALDQRLPRFTSPTRKVLDGAMLGHIIDRGLLVGTYRSEQPHSVPDPQNEQHPTPD